MIKRLKNRNSITNLNRNSSEDVEEDSSRSFASPVHPSTATELGVTSPPEYILEVDDVWDFVMEHSHSSMSRVHKRVIAYCSGEAHADLQCRLIRQSERHERISPINLPSPSPKTSVREFQSSEITEKIVQPYMTEGELLEPLEKVPMSIELARQEAMMDPDLKGDFLILQELTMIIKASVDIRTRRKRANTFLESFTGGEVVTFLLIHDIVPDRQVRIPKSEHYIFNPSSRYNALILNLLASLSGCR